MHPVRQLSKGLAIILFLFAFLLLGCSVHADKSDNGKAKKVDIETPFGSIHARKDVNAKDTGLQVYPGARPHVSDNPHEDNQANVDLSSFGFGIKVIAASFDSDDPPMKVLDFYRKQMKTYGNAIECRTEGHNFGHHKENLDDPVTCEKGPGDPAAVNSNGLELKVGTKGRQRIVEIKPEGKGTRFALVYVQLRKGKDNEV
jgi:hypothetical protein